MCSPPTLETCKAPKIMGADPCRYSIKNGPQTASICPVHLPKGRAARSQKPGFGEATTAGGQLLSFRPGPEPEPRACCLLRVACCCVFLLWGVGCSNSMRRSSTTSLQRSHTVGKKWLHRSLAFKGFAESEYHCVQSFTLFASHRRHCFLPHNR